MARSLKHTKNFKYTKHIEQFENISDAAVFTRALRRQGITQILPLKTYKQPVVIRDKIHYHFGLRYYTRELIGDKA